VLPTYGRYLRLLLGPFFRWWWATIAGVASIASLVLVPAKGITMSPVTVAAGILTTSILLFLTISVLDQGWKLFEDRFTDLVVAGIQHVREENMEYIVLLRGHLPADKGILVELRRRIGEREAPLAFLEIVGRNSQGFYQAKTLWIAPAHRPELVANRIAISDVLCSTCIDIDTIRRLKDQVLG
jgi:hypothetical protein